MNMVLPIRTSMGTEARLLLALTGKSMQEEEVYRGELCPTCNGGASGEKAFSIRRKGGKVWYRCWRASCGVIGVIPIYGMMTPDADVEEVVREKPKIFMGRLEALNRDQLDMMHDKFGLMKYDLDKMWVRWSPDYSRFAFEVMSPWMVSRGHNLRAFASGVLPKWLAYPVSSSSNWLGWAIQQGSFRDPEPPVFVVEDLISALKMSRHAPCVALMGTHLTLDMIVEINRMRKGDATVHLCLDKDATEKSFKLADKWKFFMDGTWVPSPIRCDFKDMPSKEIEAYVVEAKKKK